MVNGIQMTIIATLQEDQSLHIGKHQLFYCAPQYHWIPLYSPIAKSKLKVDIIVYYVHKYYNKYVLYST